VVGVVMRGGGEVWWGRSCVVVVGVLSEEASACLSDFL